MRPSTSSGTHRSPGRFSNTLDSNENDHPSSRVPVMPSHNDELNIPFHRRNRDLLKDMEAIILSRQDDPFLQNIASRKEKMEDEVDDNDDKALLRSEHFKKNAKFTSPLSHEMLSLLDVHEHMIRSPPPTITSTPEGKSFFSFLTQNILEK